MTSPNATEVEAVLFTERFRDECVVVISGLHGDSFRLTSATFPCQPRRKHGLVRRGHDLQLPDCETCPTEEVNGSKGRPGV